MFTALKQYTLCLNIKRFVYWKCKCFLTDSEITGNILVITFPMYSCAEYQSNMKNNLLLSMINLPSSRVQHPIVFKASILFGYGMRKFPLSTYMIIKTDRMTIKRTWRTFLDGRESKLSANSNASLFG